MRLKLICCEVLTREICHELYTSPNAVDPVFTSKGAHEKPDDLRSMIQSSIDYADREGWYDAVILGYGLCGNAANGLTAGSIPLIIPRAHDCCTLFLGSKEKFIEYFGDNPSLEWGSTGYMERGDSYIRQTQTGKLLGMDMDYEQLVERYGEENAAFIQETLYPERRDSELIFIDMPQTRHLGYLDKMRELAQEEGRGLKVYPGNIRLIRNLVNGNWNEDEFLIVPPYKSIKAVYDQDVIMTVE